MTRSSEHLDPDSTWERDASAHQVVYLVRRPGYEFVLSIPTTRAAHPNSEQARFQARLGDQHQGQEFVLNLAVLEDFYESLSRLMEYVRIEQQQDPHKYALGPDHGGTSTRG